MSLLSRIQGSRDVPLFVDVTGSVNWTDEANRTDGGIPYVNWWKSVTQGPRAALVYAVLVLTCECKELGEMEPKMFRVAGRATVTMGADCDDDLWSVSKTSSRLLFCYF